MFSLLALLLASGSGAPVPIADAVFGPDDPAIRLWISANGRFKPGDRARVQVEARDDGFLLVLQLDSDGRVHVLFPLDARDDNFVRGGRRYEVRGGSDGTAFQADRGGQGLIFSAIAPDPYRFESATVGGAWDYNLLRIDLQSPDPEADLTEVVQGIASDRGFDYDLLQYTVLTTETYAVENYYAPGVGCYPSVGYFSRCNNGYWPRGCFGCPAWYPGTGFFGFGFGSSYWDRYYGGSYYSPYGYGRGYGNGYPWGFGGGVIVRAPRDGPIIRGRPRGYTVGRSNTTPQPVRGSSGSPRNGAGRDNVGDGIDYRGRARPAPSGGNDRGARPASTERPSTGASRPTSTPPARRARGGRPEGEASAQTQVRPNMEPGRGDESRRARSVIPPSRERLPEDVSPARRVRGDGDRAGTTTRPEMPVRIAPAERSADRSLPPARRSRNDGDRGQVDTRGSTASSGTQARPQSRQEPSRSREPRLERRNPPESNRSPRPQATRRSSSPPPPPPAATRRPSPPPPPPAPSGQTRSRRRPSDS